MGAYRVNLTFELPYQVRIVPCFLLGVLQVSPFGSDTPNGLLVLHSHGRLPNFLRFICPGSSCLGSSLRSRPFLDDAGALLDSVSPRRSSFLLLGSVAKLVVVDVLPQHLLLTRYSCLNYCLSALHTRLDASIK